MRAAIGAASADPSPPTYGGIWPQIRDFLWVMVDRCGPSRELSLMARMLRCDRIGKAASPEPRRARKMTGRPAIQGLLGRELMCMKQSPLHIGKHSHGGFKIQGSRRRTTRL
jgi:hypothetical protein